MEQQKEMNNYERMEQRMRLNDQNRAEITAFSTLNQETWLGRVGFHAEEKEMVASGEKSPMVRYDGGLVYNYQYDFCIPTNDSEMLWLIRRWNTGEKNWGVFNQIYDRVQDLGGVTKGRREGRKEGRKKGMDGCRGGNSQHSPTPYTYMV